MCPLLVLPTAIALHCSNSETHFIYHKFIPHVPRYRAAAAAAPAASLLREGEGLHLFRRDSRERKPCWERYPRGASWTLVLPVGGGGGGEEEEGADALWARLCAALSAEAFDDARVVGAVAMRRENAVHMSVWHRNAGPAELDGAAFGAKIRHLLGLAPECLLRHKPFAVALAGRASPPASRGGGAQRTWREPPALVPDWLSARLARVPV